MGGIVLQENAKIGSACFAAEQVISMLAFIDGKAMRDQRFYFHATIANQIKKRLDVAAFSPPHVRKRIVMAAFFVFGIITAGSVGH